jgi:hypothetical protein
MDRLFAVASLRLPTSRGLDKNTFARSIDAMPAQVLDLAVA